MSSTNLAISDIDSKNQTQTEKQPDTCVEHETPNISVPSEQSANELSDYTVRFWNWTGIGEKKLLDLMQIAGTLLGGLAIPILGILFSYQQESINTDNQRQQILSDYFDHMTKLLLENELGTIAASDTTKMVARNTTLNTLPQLDGDRKGQLLKFLYEAHLINSQCPANSGALESQCQQVGLQYAKLDEAKFDRPIPLKGIDLTAASLKGSELPEIDLTNAKMPKINLTDANLTKALLNDAYIEGAILLRTKLVDADLRRVILSKAFLKDADLSGAHLNGARIDNADLRGAKLDKADLSNADLSNTDLRGASLQGTILTGAIYSTSRTHFPDGFNKDGWGMRSQP